MTAISDVFNELLYGSGAWIGLVILLVLCIGGSFAFKYGGTIFGIVLIFLGLLYLENVAVNDNFLWSVVLCWISALYCFFHVATEVKK